VDGLETLLPGAGLFGVFAGIIGILIKFVLNDRRLLAEADARYKAEVMAHEETQRRLDDERDARRKIEDELRGEVRKLADEVHSLRRQVQGFTGGKFA
jgi:hypothetical protein